MHDFFSQFSDFTRNTISGGIWPHQKGKFEVVDLDLQVQGFV